MYVNKKENSVIHFLSQSIGGIFTYFRAETKRFHGTVLWINRPAAKIPEIQ